MKTHYADRQSILDFAAETYQTVPEYPWQRTPANAVLRHPNGKWYGLIVSIPRCRITGASDESCDVLNVKCDAMMIGSVILQKGFYPAYHMNKNNWISILLDGSVPLEQVIAMLQTSYALVSGGSGRNVRTEPKPWLVPANPQYENLAESLAVTGEIFWKQSGKFIVGDTLYIYEGRPIGAVTYACAVAETDIPYHYNQNGLHMEKAVRLKLLASYPQTQFPLERLHDYGVASVRGPRGIPEDLYAALMREGEPFSRK